MIFYKEEILRKRAGAAHGLAAGVPPLRRTSGASKERPTSLRDVPVDMRAVTKWKQEGENYEREHNIKG